MARGGGEMTPEERAEKIGQVLFSSPSRQAECARMVKAEIGAAVEEAHGAACENLIAQCHQHVAQAYEDAAKIAENSFLDWELFLVNHAGDANLIAERAFIADRIRARAAEVGK
jgi:hypothetical protein